MEQDDFGFVTVRDQYLSLWQSVVHKVTETDNTLSEQQRLLMRQGANLHVRGEITGTKVAAMHGSPVSDDAVRHTDLSKHHYAKALRSMGATLPPSELEAEIRPYSDQDRAGWSKCEELYLKYYLRPGTPPAYRDWRVDGGGNINYSVIQKKLPNDAKVLMLGDWGTGLPDAVTMLKTAIRDNDFDAIIHLGDIYYSGTEEECRNNVTNVLTQIFQELGKTRVPFYTLPGNHDYYSGGKGFLTLLDEVNSSFDSTVRQPASYFCLRTEDNKWQFLGMDTGYNDHDPRTDFFAGYRRLSNDARGPGLVPTEKQWHLDKLNNFSGRTILLSHHQLFSANARINGINTEEQANVNERLRNTFYQHLHLVSVWFWGHEHSFAYYPDKTEALSKGRLLGSSAYEEELSDNPYVENFPSTPFAPGMKQLDLSPYTTGGRQFYNHSLAVIDFLRDTPDSDIAVTYYQYPSWYLPDDPGESVLVSLYQDVIGAPIPSDPEFFGNDRIRPDGVELYNPSGESGIAADTHGNIIVCYPINNTVYTATYDLDTDAWTGGDEILGGNVSTRDGVACVSYNDIIWIFWTVSEAYGSGKTEIRAAWRDSDGWKGNQTIHDLSGGTINPRTSETPGAVVFNNKLYVFYKGATNDDIAYFTYDGFNWQGDTVVRQPDGWAPRTNKGPAATVLVENGVETLLMVHKGDSNNKINQIRFDGNTWRGSGVITVNGQAIESNEKPSVSTFQDTTMVVYKGANSNNIYYSMLVNGTWSANTHIPDIGTPETRHGLTSCSAPSGIWCVYKGRGVFLDIDSHPYTLGWGPS